MFLNPDAWMLSFAMFFLLLIYEENLTRRGASYDICKHLLHREHHICFLKGDKLASFKVSRIQLHDLVMPSSRLEMPSKEPTQEQLIKDLNELNKHRQTLFNQINEKLNKIKSETNGLSILSSIGSQFAESGKDFEDLENLADTINTNIRAGTLLNEMRISILMLKVSLLKAVSKWKLKLLALADVKKKEDKSAGNATSRHPSGGNITSCPQISLQQSGCALECSSQSSTDTQIVDATQGQVEISPKLSINSSIVEGDLVETFQPVTHDDKEIVESLEDSCIDIVNVIHDRKVEDHCLAGASSTIVPRTAVVNPSHTQKQKWPSKEHFNPVDFQLLSPFPATLHADLYLKPGVLVDESQPSSIIAYTLSSSK